MDSRFYINEVEPDGVPEHYGKLIYPDVVGVVDSERGGIILYCDRSSAGMIVEALEAHNGDY